MADKWECPFCHSKELKVKRGGQFGNNVQLVGIAKDGPIYKEIEDFCCLAQKQNAKYTKSYYNPDERPDADEVSKW